VVREQRREGGDLRIICAVSSKAHIANFVDVLVDRLDMTLRLVAFDRVTHINRF